MHDFERYLDVELARWLDPVVASPAPRRWPQGTPLKALAGGLGSVPIDVPAFPEPAPVTVVVPAAPLR